MEAAVTFARPQHNIIAEALRSMDAAFLERARCYFGGGTAIVLSNGEYRLSLDVDFLCADLDGYRELRVAARGKGAQAVFGSSIETLRPFVADQYGIRGLFSLRGQRIKFEIIREGRIDLDGAIDPTLGVPVLTVPDQFAEKLLANADRWYDRAVAYRDAIDLGYLVRANGSIPPRAIAKAEAAYGTDIAQSVFAVLERLSGAAEVEYAATGLGMSSDEISEAASRLRDAASKAWGAATPPRP
jgi:hypothetical protein